MLKKSILLIAFIAIAGSVSAQVRPGIKVGYNLVGVIAEDNYGRPSSESGYPDNFKMKSGFQGGLIADCPINDFLAIQPGVRFAMLGFIDDHKPNQHHLRKFSLYYLQVPVYAQYRLNVAEETNVVFQAGPYAGLGLFGRQVFIQNGKSPDNFSDDLKKMNFGSEIQLFDYGIGVGAGIEFFRFQLMVSYDFGLNKVDFEKKGRGFVYDLGMHNQCLSVTFAVIFGRRDPLQNQRD